MTCPHRHPSRGYHLSALLFGRPRSGVDAKSAPPSLHFVLPDAGQHCLEIRQINQFHILCLIRAKLDGPIHFGSDADMHSTNALSDYSRFALAAEHRQPIIARAPPREKETAARRRPRADTGETVLTIVNSRVGPAFRAGPSRCPRETSAKATGLTRSRSVALSPRW
jgi:hypothetical protein